MKKSVKEFAFNVDATLAASREARRVLIEQVTKITRQLGVDDPHSVSPLHDEVPSLGKVSSAGR
jgi:hypothetical protein